jgi:hypothetical protein
MISAVRIAVIAIRGSSVIAMGIHYDSFARGREARIASIAGARACPESRNLGRIGYLRQMLVAPRGALLALS